MLISGVLILRLGYWQIVKSGELAKIARSQHLTSEQFIAPRGSILANDLSPLVTSKIAWQMFAEPIKINRDKSEIARLLTEVLAEEKIIKDASQEAKLISTLNEEERIKKLLNSGKKWILLQEGISDKGKEAIEKFKMEGIGFNKQDARFYPEGTMSAHLLGFLGKDEGGERGYFGLEGFYDVTLSGKGGIRKSERDVRGNPIPFGAFSEILPTPGLDVVTSLDRTVQYIIEKHLARGIEKYGAKSGSVVVMRPQGEILAMASLPNYDPANYRETDENLFKNSVVADSFEPGSVFKVLVMAAALDSQIIEPDTKCDSCSGQVRIDKYSIHTWDDKYYPDTTMTEVIVHSDNVGMVFVGGKLGQEKMWEYLDRFGIGRLTGIDLEEEASPILRERGKWGLVDVATASFGQGVAITPIQLVRAVAAIANKGILPVPQIGQKLKSSSWEQELKVKEEGRVIREEAAREITEMMMAAVKSGEAKWAAPRGFKIAGKTGTAQIPIAGHYDPEKTIASFIGFAPALGEAEGPQFVMLVSLREPTSSPFGSETAAPLWFSIAKDLFPYFGISPSE